MTSIPPTMRAWVYQQTGKPSDVLQLEESWPLPQPNKDFPILVKVHAAALNPVGYKLMSQAPSLLTKKPAVPEQDFAGTIAGGDLSGTDLKVGDEVFGIVPADKGQMKTGQGTLAEYTLVQPDCVTRKPAEISFAQAASLPLAGLTAYTAMVKSGNLKTGQRVLVNGGSGGVGCWAVQIAKAMNCFVVATCSGSSEELVKGLGADEIVDYKKGDVAQQLTQQYGSEDKKFDLVFDTVGVPDFHRPSAGFTKLSGMFVNISAPSGSILPMLQGAVHIASSLLRPTWLGGCPIPYKLVGLKAHEENDSLQQLKQWFANGSIKPVIDSEYPFEQAHQAYEKIMSGRSKGKVILNVL